VDFGLYRCFASRALAGALTVCVHCVIATTQLKGKLSVLYCKLCEFRCDIVSVHLSSVTRPLNAVALGDLRGSDG